ncbi:MAG: hypothetical protein AB1333_02980 [Patescibacteria group bacterium]
MKKKKKTKKITLAEIRELVRTKASKDSIYSINKGLYREDLVMLTLIEMKKKKEIFDYIKSGRFGRMDLKGIDFVVIVIRKAKYEPIRISITGPQWISYHKEKHPNIPILCVEDGDDINRIKEKLLKVINPAQ